MHTRDQGIGKYVSTDSETLFEEQLWNATRFQVATMSEELQKLGEDESLLCAWGLKALGGELTYKS